MYDFETASANILQTNFPVSQVTDWFFFLILVSLCGERLKLWDKQPFA